jgi:hypothetical protein
MDNLRLLTNLITMACLFGALVSINRWIPKWQIRRLRKALAKGVRITDPLNLAFVTRSLPKGHAFVFVKPHHFDPVVHIRPAIIAGSCAHRFSGRYYIEKILIPPDDTEGSEMYAAPVSPYAQCCVCGDTVGSHV